MRSPVHTRVPRRLPLLFALIPLIVSTLVLSGSTHSGAAEVSPPLLDRTVVSGLNSPTAMALAPDGRVFVAQQGGAVRVVKGGVLLANPFVTVTVDSSGERGLIGIALDPSFTSNGWMYLHYTVAGNPAHNEVRRYTAAGDVAAPGSALILRLPDLSSATNHNGGGLHFGPDGKLYIGVGENANGANSQSLSTPLGKVLRINYDGSVPQDNPFYGIGGAEWRIWLLGLRNPFSFAFDALSGKMLVNDVGAGGFEEVNFGFRGGNYGWPVVEGPSDDSRFTPPEYSYDHSQGCAITGAAFYRPAFTQAFPADFSGDFFFADLCQGWLRRIDLPADLPGGTFPSSPSVTQLAASAGAIVDLAVTPWGTLLYLSRTNGVLGEISWQLGWHLRNQNSDGPPSLSFGYGWATSPPLTCDWNGDGVETPAVYDRGYWYIRNAPGAGPASIAMSYGVQPWEPVCGDWDGNGTETVGVYDRGWWYLRNSNTPGPAELIINYGIDGYAPVIGDWDGNGTDTIGVYIANAEGNSRWLLRNSNTPGGADLRFEYGVFGYKSVVGDWNGDGTDTIGIFVSGVWRLRNANSAGQANVAINGFGIGTDAPVAGDWDGAGGGDTIGVVRVP